MEQLLKYLPTIVGLLNNPQVKSIIEALLRAGQQVFPEVPPDSLPQAVSTMYDSDRVQWAQVALRLLGYDVQLSGSLDDPTRVAVRDFQGKNGLDVDGWPGPITNTKLREKLLAQGGGHGV